MAAQHEEVLRLSKLKDAKRVALNRLQELQEMVPDYSVPATQERARVDLITLHFWKVMRQ